MRWFALVSAGIITSAAFADVTVKSGEPIQKAIDAAADGSTITIDAGTFREHLKIAKPLTLRGAGADKTIIDAPDEALKLTDQEKIKFVDQLVAEKNDDERMRLVYEFLRPPGFAPTIAVESAKGVTLEGLRIKGLPQADVGVIGTDSLVAIRGGEAKILNCVVIGPCTSGVMLSNGANVKIRHSLVAACWSTGIIVTTRRDARDRESTVMKPPSLHLVESDVRNCYYAGVTSRSDDTVIDRCRISGAAWHGIRYDNCSPTITDSVIFANARCGIYASGKTKGTIRGNVFWKNEMDGVSCWFDNADTIEQNTFIANLREGAGVLGNSTPTLSKNLFVGNPVAIIQSTIADKGGDPKPTIAGNQFWNNEKLMQRMNEDQPLPEGNVRADPKLANEATLDFNAPDATIAGAHHAVSAKSPWSIQPEEKLIIPDGDTRDYQQWKKPEKNK
jgi:hypothetical protein